MTTSPLAGARLFPAQRRISWVLTSLGRMRAQDHEEILFVCIGSRARHGNGIHAAHSSPVSLSQPARDRSSDHQHFGMGCIWDGFQPSAVLSPTSRAVGGQPWKIGRPLPLAITEDTANFSPAEQRRPRADTEPSSPRCAASLTKRL
jgi:hypothetical protein